MKSVLYVPTGRFNSAGQEIREPRFLSNRETAGKSIFVNGDPANGLDLRLNAASAGNQQATGYQIAIDTLTYIKQQLSTQSFYELNGKTPRDFIPISVGDGSWASNILTRRVYQNNGDFEAGLTRQGSNNARRPQSDVSTDSVSVNTFIWTEGTQYSLAEIEQALAASQWDIIEGKHAARRKLWQLGVQAIAFLGSRSGGMEGLLNNTKTNINTTFITAPIYGLNAANFATFVSGLIATYWSNTNQTKLPNRFVIPMTDWLGLQTLVPGSAGTFPTPMLNYLLDAFKAVCGPDFQIMPVAYGDASVANSLRGVNLNTYALYRHDAESFRMDIPVDFTVTQPNTLDNFTFQDVAYAQLTGVGFYKPLEVLLFQY